MGERVLLMGALMAIERGALHSDLSWVAAAGAYSGLPVEDEDPRNARYPAAPPMGVVAGEVIAASDSRKTLRLSAGMLMVAAAVVTTIIRRRRGARTSA